MLVCNFCASHWIEEIHEFQTKFPKYASCDSHCILDHAYFQGVHMVFTENITGVQMLDKKNPK